MNTIQNVVFRQYTDDSPFWEGYGLTESVYAYGETLNEVREDMCEALSVHLEIAPEEIHLCEFHELKVFDCTESVPSIWVRTAEPLAGEGDASPSQIERVLHRRDVREAIIEYLQNNPSAAASTFSNGVASTGDVVATVALPDDLLGSVLEQVGDTTRLYVCMPDGHSLYWQCVVTTEALDFNQEDSFPLDALNMGDATTVREFMRQTHADTRKSKDYLLAA